MKTSFMRAIFFCVGFVSASTNADGIILHKGKGPNTIILPERRQDAFIEFDGQREKLFLSTQADATESASVWIVPIPAAPSTIQAMPLERMPEVYDPVSPIPLALNNLRSLGQGSG